MNEVAGPSHEWALNWRLVLAAALGTGFATTQAVTLGSFIAPLQRTFGWGRSDITVCLLIGSMGTILLTPLIGALLDRFSARKVVLVGICLYAAGVAGLGLIPHSLPSWYAAWAVIALCCMGVSPVAWTLAVASRFDRHRGLALAVVLAGINIMVVFLPRLAVGLIDGFGWRMAYVMLGTIAWLLVFPTAWFWFREQQRPVDMPHLPKTATLPGLSLVEAMRTSRFWRMAVSLMLVAGVMNALVVHMQPLLTDAGVAPGTAAWIAGTAGGVSLVARIGTGFLVDRYPAPIVAAVAFAIPIISCLLLRGYDGNITVAVIAVALTGIAAGAEVDLIAFLASRYFGMRHYGKIYGLSFSLFALGWAIIPNVVARAFDATGSYDGILPVLAMLLGVSACLAATLGRYPDFASYPDDQLADVPARAEVA
jgi:MFS family permease